MEKDDAIRKVLACLNLAENPAATDGEKEAAQGQAIKLRLKFGISDDELEHQNLDDFEFFGHRMFWFSNHMEPHIDRILGEIDKALAKADKLDSLNKLQAYCKFYKKLHDRIDSRGWQPWDTLKDRRDKVITEYYKDEIERYWQQEEEWDRDMKIPGRAGIDRKDSYQQRHAHDRALFHTALYADLRKDTTENIVGVHERDFYIRDHKEQWLEEVKSKGCTCRVYFRGKMTKRDPLTIHHQRDCPLYVTPGTDKSG